MLAKHYDSTSDPLGNVRAPVREAWGGDVSIAESNGGRFLDLERRQQG